MINEQIAGLLRNNAGNPQMVSRIASENRVSQDEIAGALRIPRENAARYMGRGMGRGRGIQPASLQPAGGFRPALQPVPIQGQPSLRPINVAGGIQPAPGLQPVQPAVQPELRPIQLDSSAVMPAPKPGLQPDSTMPAQPIAPGGGMGPTDGAIFSPPDQAMPINVAAPSASFSPPDQAMPINVAAPSVMPAPVGGLKPQPVATQPAFKGPANIGKPLGNNQAFTAGFNSVRRGR